MLNYNMKINHIWLCRNKSSPVKSAVLSVSSDIPDQKKFLDQIRAVIQKITFQNNRLILHRYRSMVKLFVVN